MCCAVHREGVVNNFAIWRVEVGDGAAAPRVDQLALGLRRHLDVSGLVSITVRIADRQQSYVGLVGCGGCARARCLPGCLTEALRRTLCAAYGPSAALLRVQTGLSQRPYRRVSRLRPVVGVSPVPLDAATLAPWNEARLELVWTMHPLQRTTLLTSTLYVGAEGPDPVEALAGQGWQIVGAPLRRAPAPRPALPLLALGRTAFAGAPFLPLAVPLPSPPVEAR